MLGKLVFAERVDARKHLLITVHLGHDIMSVKHCRITFSGPLTLCRTTCSFQALSIHFLFSALSFAGAKPRLG